MSFPADLPDDIDALKAMLAAAEAQISAQNQTLAERDGIIERKEDRIVRLEKLLADFKRALYGAKSEKAHPDQYHLALEDIETAMTVVHAEDEAFDPPKKADASKARVGRGVLPKHLPRFEEVLAPDALTCGCGAERHIIGEDVSERLDIVPAQFRVIVTRRPKYACRDCEAGVTQAPAKPRLIEGGMPTEATIASVIVSTPSCGARITQTLPDSSTACSEMPDSIAASRNAFHFTVDPMAPILGLESPSSLLSIPSSIS
jgi:uncharacterized coiled-coil protein SlyX